MSHGRETETCVESGTERCVGGGGGAGWREGLGRDGKERLKWRARWRDVWMEGENRRGYYNGERDGYMYGGRERRGKR